MKKSKNIYYIICSPTWTAVLHFIILSYLIRLSRPFIRWGVHVHPMHPPCVCTCHEINISYNESIFCSIIWFKRKVTSNNNCHISSKGFSPWCLMEQCSLHSVSFWGLLRLWQALEWKLPTTSLLLLNFKIKLLLLWWLAS